MAFRYGTDGPVVEACHPDRMVFVHLSNDGQVSMNTNGASSAVTYAYTCPAGRVAAIYKMNFLLEDGTLTPNNPSVTTGISLAVVDDAGVETLDFTDGQPLKTIAQFSLLAGVDVVINSNASGDDTAHIRWRVDEAGAPVELYSGYQIQLGIRDDLTMLTDFRGMVQGVLD